MRLISCTHCAVVLNQDDIIVKDRTNQDGSWNDDKMGWDGAEYLPKICCPVCNEIILLEGHVNDYCG